MSRFILSVIFLMFCCAPVFPAEQKSIKIALISGFTGDEGLPSFHILNAIKMETERVNRAGGIKGRKLELVIQDDESNPLIALKIAGKPELNDVSAVLGFPWSSSVLVASPVLQKRKIPTIVISATVNYVTRAGNYIFRVCFDNDRQAMVVAELAYKKKNIKKAVLLVNEGNVFSTELSEATKRNFMALGGSIVHEIRYLPKEEDRFFMDKLVKIKDMDFEAFFVNDEEVYTIPFLRAVNKVPGLAGKAIFSGDGWSMGRLQSHIPYFNNFESYIAAHWDITFTSAQNLDFIKNFKAFSGVEPADISALAYDAFYVLVEALRKTPDPANREMLRKNIAATDFKGITGNIRFSPSRTPYAKDVFIYKIHDGKRSIEK